MPEWLQWSVSGLTFLVGSGGLIAWRKQKHDERRGVREDVREDHKATSADWSSFAAEMRQALSAERAESAAKQSRLTALEERLGQKDAAVRARDDHIDVLEAHIWAGNPPPPPPRPTL